MTTVATRNALGGQTSPYLLQHAGNPVHWYPWDEEALALARRMDRPVLLSVGYSACHWCHVMAHESFEDPATAGVMNDLFVNVKVDREERPDIDRIYQTAHQLLSRRNGGWPLTVFLTPDDLVPFFAGTYFPREARHGLPGFADLCRGIAQAWRDRRDDIRTQNAHLREALVTLQDLPVSPAAALGPDPLAQARAQAADTFDPEWGGFGQAPKFPHATTLERLLRDYAASLATPDPDTGALEMVLRTLERMADGGLRDHLGGGFARYSTDARWLIPHFEKMLYDNGPLLALYAQAWLLRPSQQFGTVVEELAGWALGEMQTREGGFRSSIDADSEGEEGRYYVWERVQVERLLTRDEFALVAGHYGLDAPPNFEGRHWHLHVARPLREVAGGLRLPDEEARLLLASARHKLAAARALRVPPGIDDKVLVSWNALMIRGLAIAGRSFDRPDWLAAATRALDFIRATMWRDGRLLATWKDGHAHLDAYLDDHAFLVDATLELLAARWRREDLDFAIAVAGAMLERFEDRERGGFWFTADDHEELLQRVKTFTDDALPAGNGIAACALQRLGHLLGETRYLDAAARTLRAGWASITRMPAAHEALLTALEEYLDPPETVLLRGAGAALGQWQRRATTRYAPRRLVLAIPAAESGLPGLPGLRAAPTGGDVTAWICRGQHCEAPVTEFHTLDMTLRDTEVPPPA